MGAILLFSFSSLPVTLRTENIEKVAQGGVRACITASVDPGGEKSSRLELHHLESGGINISLFIFSPRRNETSNHGVLLAPGASKESLRYKEDE